MTHKCNKKYNMHDLPIIGYKHGHCVRYARKITPIYDTLRSGMETIYIYQFQKKIMEDVGHLMKEYRLSFDF